LPVRVTLIDEEPDLLASSALGAGYLQDYLRRCALTFARCVGSIAASPTAPNRRPPAS